MAYRNVSFRMVGDELRVRVALPDHGMERSWRYLFSRCRAPSG